MIVNDSIQPNQILNSTCMEYNLQREKMKYPIMYIDEGSYVVSAKIETGVNLSN